MAIDELRRVNADEQMRAILEQRDKEERIQLTRLKAAETRGIEKGIERERREFVCNMLCDGFAIDVIAKMTGLTVEEIETIRSEHVSSKEPNG